MIYKKIEQVMALSVLFFLLSCATGVSQKSTGSKQSFQDDISAYRPKAQKDTTSQVAVNKNQEPFNPTKDVTLVLNQKLKQIASNAPSTAKGFRVMLYSGSNKEEAMMNKSKAESLIAQKVYVEYKAPNFRVKAGDAINRLEANYLLGKLKQDYPNAVVVPDDINISY